MSSSSAPRLDSHLRNDRPRRPFPSSSGRNEGASGFGLKRSDTAGERRSKPSVSTDRNENQKSDRPFDRKSGRDAAARVPRRAAPSSDEKGSVSMEVSRSSKDEGEVEEREFNDDDDLPRRMRLGKGDREVRASSSLIHRDADMLDVASLHRRSGPAKKKGKGREWEIEDEAKSQPVKLNEIKKKAKAKMVAPVKEVEKEVFIPETISVGRLARTFDVSLCESIR